MSKHSSCSRTWERGSAEDGNDENKLMFNPWGEVSHRELLMDILGFVGRALGRGDQQPLGFLVCHHTQQTCQRQCQ